MEPLIPKTYCDHFDPYWPFLPTKSILLIWYKDNAPHLWFNPAYPRYSHRIYEFFTLVSDFPVV